MLNTYFTDTKFVTCSILVSVRSPSSCSLRIAQNNIVFNNYLVHGAVNTQYTYDNVA